MSMSGIDIRQMATMKVNQLYNLALQIYLKENNLTPQEAIEKARLFISAVEEDLACQQKKSEESIKSQTKLWSPGS